jgi:two-component system nitrate/nitrite response regulator NarL
MLPMKSRSIRTLVVDDSPRVLKVLSQILAKEEGFTLVGSATDGCQALRYASMLEPQLVLMGLHLSKVSGAQAASQIKRSMNPPVVFMVGSDDDPGSRAMSDAAGADAFVASSRNLEVGLKSSLRAWFGPKPARTRQWRRASLARPPSAPVRKARFSGPK